VEQPEIICIRVKKSFIGEPFEAIERRNVNDLELNGRSSGVGMPN
jgi:hypothetical protein